MYKVQLTLTPQEVMLLESEANLLGYNLTKYIKSLISRKVVNMVEQSTITTYRMSKRAENLALQSLEEHKQGKTIKLTSLAQLDNL